MYRLLLNGQGQQVSIGSDATVMLYTRQVKLFSTSTDFKSLYTTGYVSIISATYMSNYTVYMP